MTGMPQAVQKQLDEADKRIAAIQAAAAPAPSVPVVPPQNTETPAETPAVAPVAPVTQQKPQAESQKTPQQQTLAEIEAEELTFKGRYQTLSGKFVAEVPRLAAELRQEKATTAQLRSEIQSLKAQPQQQPTAQAPAQKKSYVSDEEIETYGDVAKIGERVAREVASDQVKEALGKINSQVSPQIEEMRKRLFLDDLTKLVPDWQQTNADALFLAWLGEADPLSGIGRQDLLDHAVNAMDGQKAALIFKSFTHSMNNQEAPVSAGQPPSLASQVSPPSRSAPPSPSVQKKIWTYSEVKKIGDDFAKGAYRGRQAEFDKLQKDINQAVAEKRVRPG